MNLADGDVLDDALELFHNHQWREHKPVISVEQMAELIPVLAPLFQQSRSKTRQPPTRERRDRPTQKLPSRPVRGSSSEIPDDVREAVLERDGHACVRCGVTVQRPVYSLHHRRARGMGGSRRLHTMANLVTLCGTGTTGCHGDVESDREASEAAGWLLPRRRATVTPEEWPVLRWTPDGPQWMQPGERWAAADPHPRQVELGGAA